MRDKLLWFNEQYMKLERCLAVLAGLILLFIMLLQMFNVSMRFFIEQPLASTFEMVRLLFLTSVFLGVSYVQGKKGHIRIEILTSKLSSRKQNSLEFFGLLMSLFIVAVIAWESGKDAWQAYLTKDYTMGVTPIPLWPAKASVPFGLTVLFFRLLLDFMLLLTALRPSRHAPQNQRVEG